MVHLCMCRACSELLRCFTLQGRLEFKGIVRVDGRFEGVLKPAPGAVLSVGKTGVVVGDLEDFSSVVVDGTIIGNVTAASVELRQNAYIDG